MYCIPVFPLFADGRWLRVRPSTHAVVRYVSCKYSGVVVFDVIDVVIEVDDAVAVVVNGRALMAAKYPHG